MTITSCVLLVALLCTLHLLLGVWIGSVIRSSRSQLAAQATDAIVARACSELGAQLHETTVLSDQANHLFQICACHVPALPPEIKSATDRLAKATAALRTGVESVSQLFAFREQPRNEHHKVSALLQASASPRRVGPSPRIRQRQTGKKHPAEQSYVEKPFSISNEDFNNMTDIIRTSNSDSHIDRYQYDVFQYIAPFNHDLPGAESFKKVRCRDLSRGGFSFFLEELPNYESLVVVLGNPPDLTFLVAHVEHHRPAFIDGQRGHLIGCRFVEQVKDVYAWNDVSGGIGTRAQAEAVTAT